MSTEDFIIKVYCRWMRNAGINKHPQDELYPSEGIALSLLFVLKGMETGNTYFQQNHV